MRRSRAGVLPSCSVPPSATGCGWATPTCWAEVEQDLTVYGDECVFGGGKTLRDGLGTHGAVTAAERRARLRDHERADRRRRAGDREGRHRHQGRPHRRRSARPATRSIMDGVTPACSWRREHRRPRGRGHDRRQPARSTCTSTSTRAGLCEEAISAGITTMLGGGLGPVTVGICSSGTTNLARMLQAAEDFPLNFGFLGKGSAYAVEPLLEQIRAGAIGLKIHEDWGAMPAVIHASLDAADELDVQVQIHTDTLNESGFFERTMRRDRRADDPHLPLGGRRRRSRPGHHPRRAARRTACRPRRTRRTRTRSTRSTSTSTW